MKINKKVLAVDIIICLIIALSICSLIFSIGYVSKIANVWWQICIGWCWLILSIFIPVSFIFFINAYSIKRY